MAATANLRADLEFFIEHQQTLVHHYDGKTLLIKDQEVVGVYDDPIDAYLDGTSTYEPGTFTVQECTPGTSAYTAEISSWEAIQT